MSGKGATASRLKKALETELIRLVGTTSDPASILKTFNNTLIDPAMEWVFATLLVAVIDGDHLELALASAGHVLPLVRRVGRRVEFLADEIIQVPLWIIPEQTYENATVPVGPGEVVIFYSDGVTAVIDHLEQLFDMRCLRQAIAQAPGGAASVGQSILEAIRRFGQGRAQMDDITLLCLATTVPRTLIGEEISE